MKIDRDIVLPTICPNGTWNSAGAIVGNGSNTIRLIAADTLSGNIYTIHHATPDGQLLNVTIPFTIIASNLSSAWGVAVDPYSNVYVTYGTSVVKFPGGTVVAGGAAPDPPQSPFGICVDCFGAIYVTDYAYSRIQLWSNSSVGVTIIGYPNGTFGSGPKELNSPVDVKLDRQGNIYVLDEGNNRIQKYPPGGGTGTTVGTLPVSSGASALLVDDCGNFYVIQNLGVYKYTSASTSGTLMPPIFTGTPFGIAFDVQLNLYITVNINSTVGVTYKYAYS